MAEFVETTTKVVNCPACGSGRVYKAGKQSGEQRYDCRDCKKRFRANGKAQGRRVPSEWVGAAIRKYYAGMSYKQIAEYMKDAYDIPEPSKATIYEWVRDYTQAAVNTMKNYPAQTGEHWVVDEMQVDVGGDSYWNWNVMDSDTRYILASYLSSERDQASAEAVLRKAAAAAASPPERITTDKLPSYVPAIEEVFPKAKHTQSEGIRAELNNNRSERVQRTFRDRTKTLRGLDNRASGQRYLDGWVLHYNLFREHESLGDKTPGEAAKVDAPFKEWADVTRGPSAPPTESANREVSATTSVRRWARENRETVDSYRTDNPDLAWKTIPVAEVMANSEKQKVRQSRPAPGFHQGSRYYVMKKDGDLVYVRVSAQWGNLPAVEGKGEGKGLPERNWTLTGGRRNRSGEYAKVSQAGYIPIGEDGSLEQAKAEGTASPKARARLPKLADLPERKPKASRPNASKPPLRQSTGAKLRTPKTAGKRVKARNNLKPMARRR